MFRLLCIVVVFLMHCNACLVDDDCGSYGRCEVDQCICDDEFATFGDAAPCEYERSNFCAVLHGEKGSWIGGDGFRSMGRDDLAQRMEVYGWFAVGGLIGALILCVIVKFQPCEISYKSGSFAEPTASGRCVRSFYLMSVLLAVIGFILCILGFVLQKQMLSDLKAHMFNNGDDVGLFYPPCH